MSFTVLIADDEENARINLSELLSAKGYSIIQSKTLSETRAIIQKGDADIVLLDVNFPDGYGTDLLEELNSFAVKPIIIMITGHGDIEMAVESMRKGAHDFITKPFNDLNVLEQSISRAADLVRLRREIQQYRIERSSVLDFIVGNNHAVKTAFDQAARAAKTNTSVLITGETGTGKEILAVYIHKTGPRSLKPFFPINCAAIQPTVLESELFGYEAGAFTGADKRKLGLMEVADDGILFLDEISSMPLDIQAKLLRAIEERSIRRVGGTSQIKVDIQIIAASNRDLKTMMKNGGFREDLYYRLKVVDLHLPPLRERTEDIPELTGFFIKTFNRKMGMNVESVDSQALTALKQYSWPGNIRELRNAIERAFLFCDGQKITLADLPADVRSNQEASGT